MDTLPGTTPEGSKGRSMLPQYASMPAQRCKLSAPTTRVGGIGCVTELAGTAAVHRLPIRSNVTMPDLGIRVMRRLVYGIRRRTQFGACAMGRRPWACRDQCWI